MDFREVIEALKIIRKYCQGKTQCSQCRLHTKNDYCTCSVSPSGMTPSSWDFDLDPDESVPSIFKK